MYKLNLNSYAYIELTEKGYEYLDKNRFKHSKPLGIAYYKDKTVNGYYRMQMHEFINVFGEIMTFDVEYYLSTTVMFDESDIEKGEQ